MYHVQIQRTRMYMRADIVTVRLCMYVPSTSTQHPPLLRSMRYRVSNDDFDRWCCAINLFPPEGNSVVAILFPPTPCLKGFISQTSVRFERRVPSWKPHGFSVVQPQMNFGHCVLGLGTPYSPNELGHVLKSRYSSLIVHPTEVLYE